MARTQWLFHLCVMIALLITTVGSMVSATGRTHVLVGVTALVGLCSWSVTYRRGSDSAVRDVVDVVGLLGFAAACPQPEMAFGLAFPALWFRSLYGRTWRIWLYVVGQSVALVAASFLWRLLPGHEGPSLLVAVLGTLPVLLLFCFVARYLAVNLVAREQSQRRDVVLSALGSRLLGSTDVDHILDLAAEAIAGLCHATPGLLILVVQSENPPFGDHLAVVGAEGPFRSVPDRLPGAVLRAAQELSDSPRMHHPELIEQLKPLEKLGNGGTTWLVKTLPDTVERHLLVGAPGGPPADALVALTSLVNQVALSRRVAEQHSELAHQASTDALTGLANRTALVELVDQATRVAAPTGGGRRDWVLLVDLDGFKAVNDTHGHAAGDQLLQVVAGRLTAQLRTGDACARLGGDEFAALVRDLDSTRARELADRLVSVLSQPAAVEGQVVRVGASIGLAPVVAVSSGQAILRNADAAMYQAKSAGRNRARTYRGESESAVLTGLVGR